MPVVNPSLTPSGFAFTRNPIFYRDGAPGTIDIECCGKRYSARMLTPGAVNLADIVDSLAPDFGDPGVRPGIPGSEWLIELEDSSFLDEYLCTVSNNDGDDLRRFIPLRGGVPYSTLKGLDAGEDVFTRRFLAGGNFFMTSRTASDTLVIKETELYPLCFIQPTPCDIVVDAGSGYTCSAELPAGIYAFDVEAFRRYMFFDRHYLPSVLTMRRDNASPCTIVVQEAMPSQERHRLKFRNRLGAFEVIELTGQAQLGAGFGIEDTDDTYKEYNAAFDDFFTRSMRREAQSSLTVNTGPKNAGEFVLLAELLASEEVWMLDYNGRDVRVIVSAEDFTRARRIVSPTSVDITVKFCEDVEPSMVTRLHAAGIFSPQFTDVFN